MSGYLAQRETRRLRTLSRIARVTIGIYLAVWLVQTLLAIWALSFVATGVYGAAMFMAAQLTGLAAAIGILAFLPSALFFLLWFHKAIANLHDAGLSGLEARAGWSVGSFFVPLVGLWVPFGAMRELWNRSHGEDEWQAKASVGDVGIWWLGFVAGTLVIVLIDSILVFNALTNLEITTPRGVNEALNITGTSLWCLSAFFLFRIVGKVTRAQQTLSDDRLAFL
ncbi:DUF4328 domain-containing protein [Novosphingobium resinovorum]|uniref:DUF4328 domain-containing protein n=1 Tax=Novosphingobium resinovorum TaxID=158500 RepID=UPI002ED454EE|nr:DUF4328 domain-containing protein [Novosphingobium resinovorum]